MLVCKKKTSVLVCLPGEILEKAPPIPSRYTPRYPPSAAATCVKSVSIALLFLFICVNPAAGYVPEAEGTETHGAVFLPTK